jgi:hypothetical protein
MQPIGTGLSDKNLSMGAKERLQSEIRIRFNDRGVVQEMSSP